MIKKLVKMCLINSTIFNNQIRATTLNKVAYLTSNIPNKLNVIHHTALGATRILPTISLLYESEEWSLSLRRKHLILNKLAHTESAFSTPAGELHMYL